MDEKAWDEPSEGGQAGGARDSASRLTNTIGAEGADRQSETDTAAMNSSVVTGSGAAVPAVARRVRSCSWLKSPTPAPVCVWGTVAPCAVRARRTTTIS